MQLKTSIFLTMLALIGTACAFSVPLQTDNGSEPITNTPEVVADETTVTPIAKAALPTEPAAPLISTPETLEPIVLPISVYILDDTAGELSSTRTTEQLGGIYGKVNEIWGQADIVIEVQSITRINVSPTHLEAIANRDFAHFFGAIRNGEIDIPDPSLLNAFYARDIGGPNGITPFGTRAFFVMDTPSVHHERVTSHEIGHILGLHHVLNDADHLMFSGTNGMLLSEEEIIVARYAARGLLDGVR